MCESFFVTLECELIDRHRFATKAEAQIAVSASLRAAIILRWPGPTAPRCWGGPPLDRAGRPGGGVGRQQHGQVPAARGAGGGREVPADGIRIASSAAVGVSRQDLGQLDAFASPWDAVGRSADLDDTRGRALLARAGIGVEKQSAPIVSLSGGHRARLAMLLRLARPSLYLLDEPTNNLDIEGQEVLEAELARGEAAAFIVSHNCAFVRSVGTRFWQVDRQCQREVEGPEAFFEAMMAA